MQTKEALNFLHLSVGIWSTCANALKETLLPVQMTEDAEYEGKMRLSE